MAAGGRGSRILPILSPSAIPVAPSRAGDAWPTAVRVLPSRRRCLMSIAPEEFLPYITGALDGMVQIVEALGDERVNLRPNNMPNTNSPFAILTHCLGLTRYWIGAVLA